MASATAWGRVAAAHSNATELNGADDSMHDWNRAHGGLPHKVSIRPI